MKLFNMRSTKDVKLHRLYEDGVKRTHNVLKKATRRVKDLHGACRKRKRKIRRRKGFEV
jgi:hypothetical protein